MNFYRLFKKAKLQEETKTGSIQQMNLSEPVVSFKKEDFHSDRVVPIVEGEVLDTSDPTAIAKYESNLRVLKKQMREKGKIDRFLLIREDDLLPPDWMWRVNSKNTSRELAKSRLAYTLRMLEVQRRIKNKNKNLQMIDFPVPDVEAEREEFARLDSNFGKIYEPSRFRSTKHFTINLPLPYTGKYNQVASGRNFVIIDTPDAFCKSGYGYSADYQDAYLDVTHEPLRISGQAIVLINESRYPELIKDERIKEQLKERRVILYRGDEATAINMVLTQEGVLPYRPGGNYSQFDPEEEDIMTQSMMRFCDQNHLEYAIGHGNIDGKGGHFSDLFDSENTERVEFEKEFISFLREQIPDKKNQIDSTLFYYPDKKIEEIGYERVLEAVQAYNEWAKKDEVRKLRAYDLERDKVSLEDHELFIQTIQDIHQYADSHRDSLYPMHLTQLICDFFHSPSVDVQREAARQLQEFFKETEKKK